MKDLFHGYYDPSNNELQKLWEEAIFVFDTNTLLNLYRYSDATRENLLNLISRLRDNLSIPYQVAKEFFENRFNVIFEQVSAYKDLHSEIIAAEELLKKSVQKLRKHPTLDKEEVQKKVESAFSSLKIDIKNLEGKHPDLTQNDHVLEKLTIILSNKLRAPASEAEQKANEKWAEDRFNKGIPPGTADKNKTGDKKLGDGLIWHEILELAKETSRPVVFVTDDVKDDWWLRVNGRTIGPRPELRQEFYLIAKQRFHMYRTEQFMKYGGEHFKLRVDSETLDEAAFVRELTKESHNSREFAIDGIKISPTNFHEHYNSLLEEKNAILNVISSSKNINPHLKKDLKSRLKFIDIATKEFERTLRATQVHRATSTTKMRLIKIVAQQYYESEGEFYPLGDITTIDATESEIEIMNEIESPVWIDRLNGFYSFVDFLP
ncbi:PIN domain-containing protein [Burkholderia ubonensis]|uniref:PIN domain-containing protein n=1 Tax=Burkholderia ubonensis TaxID=101571 RepID=UPI000B1BC26A|nr:PIN domain-containing protein [Burkholderia ubonensis]